MDEDRSLESKVTGKSKKKKRAGGANKMIYNAQMKSADHLKCAD